MTAEPLPPLSLDGHPEPTSTVDGEGMGKRFDQCDETCTVDCGHCKGQGKPWTDVTENCVTVAIGEGGAYEALRWLAEEGLLVTPDMRAVLDAARTWRAETTPAYEADDDDAVALIAAVDALGGESR